MNHRRSIPVAASYVPRVIAVDPMNVCVSMGLLLREWMVLVAPLTKVAPRPLVIQPRKRVA